MCASVRFSLHHRGFEARTFLAEAVARGLCQLPLAGCSQPADVGRAESFISGARARWRATVESEEFVEKFNPWSQDKAGGIDFSRNPSTETAHRLSSHFRGICTGGLIFTMGSWQ